MLFNSYPFLLLFLPLVLAGCFALARWRQPAALAWLVLASLAFYGWWDVRYVPLLAASVAFNYCAGQAIAGRGGRAGRGAGLLLAAGVAANLALLGWFKYAGFFAAGLNALHDTGVRLGDIVLPLGISFFTFTQIAYLVDMYRDPVRYGFMPYALFVTYFPHLIAGPILHHREMMPQFAAAPALRWDAGNLAAGATLFAIGLFKKTVIADGIGPYAAPVFEHAAHGYAPSLLEAWGAALAFGLQLYFDFSAYSDMAIGLSKMFGIRLPLNFDSPYKAASIIEFWRRWHMTLSRFLREYLYIPLGGNRHGALRRYLNLFVTMLLGGLWHGAGWTFVAWGAAHGALLALNHGWRALRGRFAPGPGWIAGGERALGAALTFVAVFAAWVLFRAENLGSAVSILRGMAGLNGFVLPPTWTAGLADLGRWAAARDFGGALARRWIANHLLGLDVGIPRGLTEVRGGGVLVSGMQVLWIGALLGIVWCAPNARQLMQRADAIIADARSALRPTALVWRPSAGWALAAALLLTGSVLSMARISEFLYFQF